MFALIAAAMVLAAAACGGDDDDDGGGGGGATSPAAAEGPGTITLTSTAISGQDGKILLAFAVPATGGERVARLCVPITSDDFTVLPVVMTEVPEGNDPCGGDTSETTLDEGTYTITAGVYVGGQQTPEAETTVTVEVAGDAEAELDGAELSD
jgi:hypothetical protein